MKSLLILATTLLMAHGASAMDSRIDLGWGAGTTYPFAPNTFSDNVDSGQSNNYYLGYHFSHEYSLELGYDRMDYDTGDAITRFYSLGIKRFWNLDSVLTPFAHLGLGWGQSEVLTEKKSDFGLQAGIGLEYLLMKYVSVGMGLKYTYVNKVYDATSPEIKNAQTLMPHLFLVLHTPGHDEKRSEPVVEAKGSSVVATVKPVDGDDDKDGIPNSKDRCSGTPDGSKVNAYGCAVEEKGSIAINIQFATGKDVIQDEFKGDIQKLAEFMKEFPQTTVEVQGHSDSTGSAKINTALSQKRANAIRHSLVNEYGIASGRVTAKGYGSSKPIADNSTLEGRQKNRRVIAEITDAKK